MTAKGIRLAYSRPKVLLAAKTCVNDPLKPVLAAAGVAVRLVTLPILLLITLKTDFLDCWTRSMAHRDRAAAIAAYSRRFPETQLTPINTSYGDGAMQRMWRPDIRQR